MVSLCGVYYTRVGYIKHLAPNNLSSQTNSILFTTTQTNFKAGVKFTLGKTPNDIERPFSENALKHNNTEASVEGRC